MASRSFMATLVVAVLSLIQFVASLQVTPGSPCSSFCIDSPELDDMDPESSNTEASDIVCSDSEYGSKPKGQKFQRCLTCLQGSDFTYGEESDQQWFFYNLRYAIDYCILGFPNATDIGGTPCATRESCGAFEESLKDGMLEPAYAQPYQFCEKDKGRLSSHYMETCQACVGVEESQSYIVNFLMAIRAGCEQQPADGVLVGLSDTVFTTSAIEIALPSSSSGVAADDDASNGLSPPIIAAVAIGALVLILLGAGCTYMQIRKRQNRRARLRRASALSFRCQTHVTPKTPNFPREDVQRPPPMEKSYVDPADALNSNPITRPTPNSRRVTITTTVTPIKPPPPVRGYPSPETYYTTPTSTTSSHSNAPLLSNSYKPYQPTEYIYPPSTLPGLAITTPDVSPPPEQQNFPYSQEQTGASGGRKSPVGSTLQVSFPPPPPRPRRW